MFTERDAIALLIQKADELSSVPKKSDFPNEDVARIKSRLGPWPRALEVAGLKERKNKETADVKKRQKRKKCDAEETTK